jgi:ABC-type nitrate/sulfonate/bicarbonate transport system substrate-binding protein
VPDLDSPSYFVLTAAVELGYFAAEGLDAERLFNVSAVGPALREGQIDFLGAGATGALGWSPDGRGVKLLCALSQYTYWFLSVRADLHARQGDLDAIKGLRIAASKGPSVALEHLLTEAGIDFERDNVRIIDNPEPVGDRGYQGDSGIRAIKAGIADAYWGNGMRAELGVRQGIASVLLDVRRGDGPPGSRNYTFPALLATDRLIEERPDAAAAAVRAVVKAQRALKADPSLATPIGRRLFPPDEAELIAELIARDTPFYDPTISAEAVAGMQRYGQAIGLLDHPVPYEQVVATQFRHLWTE